MMMMGCGAATNISQKQRTNTRISLEVKLIGVYDELPSALHAKYFLETMGYLVSCQQEHHISVQQEQHHT
jgi:hypothetical protein